VIVTRRTLLLAGAAGVAGCVSPDAVESEKPRVHPLTGLLDFTGLAVTPPRILGAVTIVDFWASWCAPCRQAFRHMDQLYRTYKGDGLDMIAVSVDDDAQAARRFWAMAKPRFPVAWDGGGEVRERFSVSSLPTTVLFDPNGFLVQRNEGFDPADHRLLEEHVHRLLRA
jgi:thiol-disulfide isomerase/thioredoxin